MNTLKTVITLFLTLFSICVIAQEKAAKTQKKVTHTQIVKWEASTLNGKYIGVSKSYLGASQQINILKKKNKNTDNQIIFSEILYTTVEGESPQQVFNNFINESPDRNRWKFLKKSDLYVMDLVFKENKIMEAVDYYKKANKIKNQKKAIKKLRDETIVFGKYLLKNSYSNTDKFIATTNNFL